MHLPHQPSGAFPPFCLPFPALVQHGAVCWKRTRHTSASCRSVWRGQSSPYSHAQKQRRFEALKRRKKKLGETTRRRQRCGLPSWLFEIMSTKNFSSDQNQALQGTVRCCEVEKTPGIYRQHARDLHCFEFFLEGANCG